MKIGFTGTSRGATAQQVDSLGLLLERLSPEEIHLGDCIGADAQAHAVARRIGLRTVGHLPSDPKKRAHCTYHEEREALPYKERNQAIAAETDALIACSLLPKEINRSGTWHTIRCARKLGRPIWIIWPDGSVKHEGGH